MEVWASEVEITTEGEHWEEKIRRWSSVEDFDLNLNVSGVAIPHGNEFCGVTMGIIVKRKGGKGIHEVRQ